MPKFIGTVIYKQYYEVVVDAEDKDQARDLLWDSADDCLFECHNKPYDTDVDIGDEIEEIENA